MGLSGIIWCVFAGLCYGTMNVLAKLAYNNGMIVTRLVLMRFSILALLSYTYGKLFRKTDFDLRKYDKSMIGIVFFRSALSLFSKTCQYAAISYIPLSMSSCISFTTGPILAGLLAFLLIREKLSTSECVAILFGILGTMMLTMPQWFLFLGLDSTEIKKRLSNDLALNNNYYLGIIVGLFSSALDTATYFIIRKVGDQIPKSLFPFISGVFTTAVMLLYTSIYDPLDW